MIVQSCVCRLKTGVKPERFLYAGVMVHAHGIENTGAGICSHPFVFLFVCLFVRSHFIEIAPAPVIY